MSDNSKTCGGCGRINSCKECKREYMQAYRARNPRKASENSRSWRERNPNATAEQNARWYAANGDKRRAQLRELRAADPAPSRKASKEWRARNPLAVLETGGRRRAMKQSAVFGRVDYRALRATHDDCYLCGLPLSGRLNYDHTIPLSRGGSHSSENMRPTHERCNLRKHASHLWNLDWYSGPTLIGAWAVRPIGCKLST